MNHCEECGFTYDSVAAGDIPAALRSVGGRLTERVRSVDAAAVRMRPSPEVWSVLEYGCHIRDVFRFQRERVDLALREDTPEFTPMRRDERVVEDRYNEQDPSVVADEIAARADELAATFAALSPAERERTCVYGWPEKAVRTLTWVGRHTVHEGEHHLQDITSPAGSGSGSGS